MKGNVLLVCKKMLVLILAIAMILSTSGLSIYGAEGAKSGRMMPLAGGDSRASTVYQFDDHIISLKIGVVDGRGSDTYEYEKGNPINMREIERTAQLTISLEFNVNESMGNDSANNNNPAVYGDKFTCAIPKELSNANGGHWGGRLADPTTAWGMKNGSVGDFEIVDGRLTITFDKEYIDETGGNIKKATLAFKGFFNTYGWEETPIQKALKIGNIPVNVSFPAQEAIRNMTIEKSVANYEDNEFSETSGNIGKNKLNGTAKVDDEGYVTYTVRVTAGTENTDTLTNVTVTDVFDSDNVVPDSFVLVKAVRGVADSDITNMVNEKRNADNELVGWNIGDLRGGEQASITFKAKVDKAKITADVDGVKNANSHSEAKEERTLKNTATVSADKATPVSTTETALLQNYLTVSKKSGKFDAGKQRQYFTITITSPADNKYTQHNVSVRDNITANDKGFVESCGIEKVKITHMDSTVDESETGELHNGFTYRPGATTTGYVRYNEWSAYINEVRPGDVVEITSYIDVDKDKWYELGTGTGYSGINGSSACYNYVYLADQDYNYDLGEPYESSYFYLNKLWLSKSSTKITADGVIKWTVTGNQYNANLPDADISGLSVSDKLGPNMKFTDDSVEVTFYERTSTGAIKVKPYNGPNSLNGKLIVPIDKSKDTFEFPIPDGYGKCRYTYSYNTQATNNYGPSYTYKNTAGLGHWQYTAQTIRPRIASMDKKCVLKGKDWADWETKIFCPVADGDTYVDQIGASTTLDVMYMTQAQFDSIKLMFNGKEINKDLYDITADVPTTGAAMGKIKGFTIKFKGDVTDTNAGGDTINPSTGKPIIITYRTQAELPAANAATQYRDYRYENRGTITVNGLSDSDSDLFWKSNKQDISKSVKSVDGNTIVWTVRVNKNGESTYPMGSTSESDKYNMPAGMTTNNELIFTETIPKGLKFVAAKYASKGGDNRKVPTVEVVGDPVVNRDGTTTVKIKVSDITHYGYDKNNYANSSYFTWHGYVWVDVDIVTKVNEEAFLYNIKKTKFSWENTASIVTRDGLEFSSSAAHALSHEAMKKEMVYDQGTAPYAHFTLTVNQDKFDMNPDGDKVTIYDKSSSTLIVDTSSIRVINIVSGADVPYSLDTAEMSKGLFAVEVPDDIPLKIQYQAYVAGVNDNKITLENKAYFMGMDTDETSCHIERDEMVLDSNASAQSDIMVWLMKMDALGGKLPNATFLLEKYDGATKQWVVQTDNIVSSGSDQYGTKLSGLDNNILYRLKEKSAPEGYAKDESTHYFCLKIDKNAQVAIPDDVEEKDIVYCKVAALMNLYNNPYVSVKFLKRSDTGAGLANARFKVVDIDGNTAKDKDGNEIEFTSTTAAKEYVMEAGIYKLIEISAPVGYYQADPIAFTVKGDKTVTVGGRTVDDNTVVCENEATHAYITKVDGTGNNPIPLSGAVLQVLDGGTVIEEWTSTTDAKDIAGKLEVGKEYTLHEKTTPSGYLTASDITFTVEDDGTITTRAQRGANGEILLVNKKPVIGIAKIGTKDNGPLAGAGLQLLDGTNVVHQWTSGAMPEIISNLETGKTYTVHESTGIEHYDVFEDFTVKINEDGTVNVSNGNVATYENGILTVKNTYHPEAAKLKIPVNKLIAGELVPQGYEETFTFNMTPINNAPTPARGGETATVTGAGSTEFGEITFDKEGTYKYKISEVAGSKKGYVYDDAEHIVTVTITDDNGVLKATFKVDEQTASAVTFNNEYNPTATKISIPVQKVITGNDRNPNNLKSFQFEITADSSNPKAPMPQNTVIRIEDAGNGLIGEIPFKSAGVYKYNIKEIKGTEGGYEYSQEVHSVTVTVEDEAGVLKADYVVDQNGKTAVFTNAYNPKPVSNIFTVSKVISGNDRPLGRAQTFGFILKPKNGAPMPAGANGEARVQTVDAGVAQFDSITYDRAGTYEYTVEEETGRAVGYSYSTDVYDVTVVITDNNGTLEKTVMYKKNNNVATGMVFTNTYAPAVTTVAFPVEKQIQGNSRKDGAEKNFTFALTGEGDAPLPPGAKTAKIKDVGSTSFGTITFDKAGIYTYRISEQNDQEKGYTYSSDVYTATVEVTDNGGRLSSVVSYSKNNATAEKPVFVNTYAPQAGQLQLPIEKVITGVERQQGNLKKFKFTLTGKDSDTPMPDGNGNVVEITDEGSGKFGNITFDKAGTYNYSIEETNDGATGYGYDTNTHHVKVVVTDNDGVLDVNWTIDDKTAKNITITNTYNPKEAPLEVPVRKLVDGVVVPAGYEEEFTFNIEAKGDAPLPENSQISINGAGTAKFGKITFKKPGNYTYEVSEAEGNKHGYVYDLGKHIIHVNVVDNNGVLEYTWKIDNEAADANSKVEFKNSYKPDAAIIAFPVEKITEDHGRLQQYLKTFEFVISADPSTPDAPLPNNPTTAIVDSGSAKMGQIAFEDIGVYKYVLKEKDGKLTGYTYDTTPRNIVVTVEDKDQNGKLSATYTIDGDSANKTAIFTNEYNPTETKQTFSVTKAITGNDRPANNDKTFEFVLSGKTADTPMPEAGKENTTVTGTGKGLFGEITYNKSGTYEYTIVETAGGETGYSYSNEVWDVKVVVTDDDGVLVARTTYSKNGVDGTEAVFTNRYAPTSVLLNIPVEKKITGDNPTTADFRFVLEADGNAPMPDNGQEVKQIRGIGETSFGSIEFKAAGTYKYIVSEEAGTADGYKYDKVKHHITVQVVDNDGTLQMTWEDAEKAQGDTAVTFVNRYKPVETSLTIPVEKTFSADSDDRQEDKTFTFEMYNAAGDMIDSKSVVGAGTVNFDPINFDDVGTYTYTIKEKAGNDLGYTYDKTVHDVTVNVTDNNGRLNASWTLDQQPATANTAVTFENRYINIGSGVATFVRVPISVKKTVDGNDGGSKKSFQFKIEGLEQGTPQPKTDTVTIDGSGTAQFDSILFGKAGTFKYTVTEVEGNEPGYTYDRTKHQVVVKVSYEDGDFHTAVTVDGRPAGETPVVEFTNLYRPEKAKVKLPVRKVVKGDKPDRNSKFYFEIAGNKNAPMPKSSEVSINGSGSESFDIVYSQPGTYRYTVVEIPSDEIGYTYDSTRYAVVVEVTDKDGVLTADWTVNGIKSKAMTFVNSYSDKYVSAQNRGDGNGNGISAYRRDDNAGNGRAGVNTGDDSPLYTYVNMLVASMCALGAIVLGKRRRNGAARKK